LNSASKIGKADESSVLFLKEIILKGIGLTKLEVFYYQQILGTL
jgi:hypothetical protein